MADGKSNLHGSRAELFRAITVFHGCGRRENFQAQFLNLPRGNKGTVSSCVQESAMLLVTLVDRHPRRGVMENYWQLNQSFCTERI
jgi:hypothetical protein